MIIIIIYIFCILNEMILKREKVKQEKGKSFRSNSTTQGFSQSQGRVRGRNGDLGVLSVLLPWQWASMN